MLRVLTTCMLALGVAACGESIADLEECSGECINIGLQNSSDSPMTVTISRTGRAP